MNPDFLNEAQCYKILQKYDINTPRYIFLGQPELGETFFNEDEQIVLKAVVNEVWHKSDSGLIKFAPFSSQVIQECYNTFYERVKDKKDWQGLLVCEKVSSVSSELPIEILLSIKHDSSCGPIITIGFGGIHTELWGKELKNSVLNFYPEITNPEDAFADLSEHLLGKILFGEVRHGEAPVSEKSVRSLLNSVWELAVNLQSEEIS